MKVAVPDMFVGSSPQLLAVLAGTINVVSDGMQYGWTSPTIPILKSVHTPVKISHTDEVWLEMLYMIGGFLGLPFSIKLVDIIGRKMTVWFSSVIGIFGWICIAVGPHVYYLFIGRLLLGITADIAFTASPIYISEIAHQRIRGFLAGLIYLMMLFGIVVMYAIGPWIPIYSTASVGILLLVSQLVIFPFMPESPYYLVYKGRINEAKEALKRLRIEDDVSEELRQIQVAVERQKLERGRPIDLFLIDSNRKAALIMILLNYTMHAAGISVLIMNLHSILKKAGSNISPNLSAIIFPCLMLICSTVATLMIDYCGRKILLGVSGVITSITLLILAVFFHLQFMQVSVVKYSWIPLLAVMVYAAGVKLGLGLVPIIITAELFPAKVKGMGIALADFTHLFFSVISLYLFQWLHTNFGYHIPFYVCGFLCIISTILISLYVPETKGRTLEEIQMILKHNMRFSSKTQDTRV